MCWQQMTCSNIQQIQKTFLLTPDECKSIFTFSLAVLWSLNLLKLLIRFFGPLTRYTNCWTLTDKCFHTTGKCQAAKVGATTPSLVKTASLKELRKLVAKYTVRPVFPAFSTLISHIQTNLIQSKHEKVSYYLLAWAQDTNKYGLVSGFVRTHEFLGQLKANSYFPVAMWQICTCIIDVYALLFTLQLRMCKRTRSTHENYKTC